MVKNSPANDRDATGILPALHSAAPSPPAPPDPAHQLSPGESHGQRTMADDSPRGRKESLKETQLK